MMKPALAFRQPKVPKTWQQLPCGDEVINQMNDYLDAWSAKFFGYHLLKLGALSNALTVANTTISHQVSVTQSKKTANVIADIDELPFLEHSIDVCLLAHCLEFSVDPHHVIREANRVLIPNGYLVITGYNPFGLAGLNKLIPFKRKKSPWCEHFFSPMRVKDWLHLMGYEVLDDHRCVYSMMASQQYGQGVIRNAIRQFSSHYLPFLGSVYIIVAKKRTLPLTPIKPKWQLRPKFSPIGITTRTQSEN